jgi:hypothetical protein
MKVVGAATTAALRAAVVDTGEGAGAFTEVTTGSESAAGNRSSGVTPAADLLLGIAGVAGLCELVVEARVPPSALCFEDSGCPARVAGLRGPAVPVPEPGFAE